MRTVTIKGITLKEGDKIRLTNEKPWIPILTLEFCETFKSWYAATDTCKYGLLLEEPTRTPYFGIRPCDWELVENTPESI